MNQGEQPVEAYIQASEAGAREMLAVLRRVIREVAPGARERMSYGMPFFEYKGSLAWFGIQRNHVGLYLRPPVIQEHPKELEGYVTTKSAVHFPLGREVDVSLVKWLVRARMKMNEAEAKHGRR
ncbi:MAG TPA: DUF1801 domain-containing protein [Nitrososphaerales archaeon]|nr:DUF1801 domain-containing protein [Nitrososphaerales archaeon]